MTTDIGDLWVPKRGKAGKEFNVRHPLRGSTRLECGPVRIRQIYTADKAALVVDEQGQTTIVKVADLRKHWKRSE